MATWTRTLADLTVVGVGVALIVKMFGGFESRSAEAKDDRVAVSRAFEFRTIQRGDEVALLGHNFSRHELTAVLSYAEDCRFCRLSTEFHKRLSRELESKQIPLVVVTEDNHERVGKLLQRLGVAPSAVLSGNALRPMVGATPTLLLVDRSGQLKGMWVGKVSPATEAYILAQLSESGPKETS